ncbi:MAG: hypothetical protein EXR99_09665 [Gemmataceae bacterium]|nr:hypothetical protein [Gemmataceae bacterium]
MVAKSRKEQIEEMLAEDPRDSFLLYGLAMEHLSTGAEDLALKALQNLMALQPDYPPGYLQAGQLLARLGKEPEARDVYRVGIQVAQKAGDSHAAGEMENFLSLLD